MVFVVIEAAVALRLKETIVIPNVLWISGGILTQKIKWSCTIVGEHAYAAIEGFDAHAPIAGVSSAMKIAIIDKHFRVKLNWRNGVEQCVTNVSGVFTLTHPDAFFEARVAHRINPSWNCSIEMKAFDVLKSLRSDRAASPFVRGKFVECASVIDSFVQRCDELGARDGRLQRGEKNAVIMARGASGDSAGSVAANCACHEPFTGGSRGKIVANAAIESDDRFCYGCHACCLLSLRWSTWAVY